MKVSPTQRSLKFFRDLGFTCGITEKNVRIPDKTVPGGWRVFKQDLFGFCDIVAVHPDVKGTTFIQTTSGLGSHRVDRMEKIQEAPAALQLLKAGNAIEFHGWRKVGARGAPKRFALKRYIAKLVDGKITWVDADRTEVQDEDDDFEPQKALFAGVR
jgi:hypothetical protein